MKEVLEIAQRWNVESIAGELQAQAINPRVTVGFLGDFSSGKSTLINALIRAEGLLPVRLEPCTATAGLVLAVAGTVEPTCYRLLQDGTQELITKVELDDVARGLISGRPLVHVAPSEVLPEGLGLADTPGLGSFTPEHQEVMFAELPYLDAAVICVDLQKGGITKEIQSFLKSAGVRHLQQRFLIALTHADQKPPAEVERVRNSAIFVLSEILGKPECDVRERVVTTAAGQQARERGRDTITELQSAIQQLVVRRRNEIAEERRGREVLRIIPRLKQYLIERSAAIRADDKGLREQVSGLEKASEDLKCKRVEHQKKLEGYKASLTERVQQCCLQSIEPLARAKDDSEIQGLFAQLTSRLNDALVKSTGEFQAHMSDVDLSDSAQIRSELAQVNKFADVAKTVATAALVAAVLPNPASLASVVANAGQAAGGVLVQGAGKAGESIAKSGAQSSAPAGIGRIIGGTVLKSLNDVNVINLLGDYLALEWKREKLEGSLQGLADEVVSSAIAKLDDVFEQEVFSPVQANLLENRSQIDAAQKTRRKDNEDKQKDLRLLEVDLVALSTMELNSKSA